MRKITCAVERATPPTSKNEILGESFGINKVIPIIKSEYPYKVNATCLWFIPSANSL